MQNNDFKLANVSAILVAESQNPSIINRDFLKNARIVDNGWEVKDPETFSMPPFAQVVYRNGVTIRVDPNRCEIQQEVRGKFQPSYHVHECARKYAEVLEHIPYKAVGMNWLLQAAEQNPGDWLKSRYLRTGKWSDNITPTRLDFTIQSEDSTVYNFFLQTLQTGHTLQMGEILQMEQSPRIGQAPKMEHVLQRGGIADQNSILLNCNAHFDLQSVSNAVRRISDVLQNVAEHQRFVQKVLDDYLLEELE